MLQQRANPPQNIFQDIWDYAEKSGVIVIVPKFQLSHQICFLFAARIATACKSVFELSSSSILISLPFLLNHVQRSLTSLPLRVILAHTLAKIGDDAGAFILFCLVSETQRRRQKKLLLYSDFQGNIGRRSITRRMEDWVYRYTTKEKKHKPLLQQLEKGHTTVNNQQSILHVNLFSKILKVRNVRITNEYVRN